MRCRYPQPFGLDVHRNAVDHRSESAVLTGERRCGHCVGCIIYRRNEWTTRAFAEAHTSKLRGPTTMLTLTYAPEHLPQGGVDVTEMQRFWKRLRHHYPKAEFRYMYCGEYGSQTQRPHYHALLHGFMFPDYRAAGKSRKGSNLYLSDSLTEIWGKGSANFGIGYSTSAAKYVAEYVLAQPLRRMVVNSTYHEEDLDMRGKRKRGRLKWEYSDAGGWRKRPFFRVSQGYGREYVEKYHSQIFADPNQDPFILIDGKVHPAPHYFWEVLKQIDTPKYDLHRINFEERNETRHLQEERDIHREEAMYRASEYSINRKDKEL